MTNVCLASRVYSEFNMGYDKDNDWEGEDNLHTWDLEGESSDECRGLDDRERAELERYVVYLSILCHDNIVYRRCIYLKYSVKMKRD
jgi:hypothetical protein